MSPEGVEARSVVGERRGRARCRAVPGAPPSRGAAVGSSRRGRAAPRSSAPLRAHGGEAARSRRVRSPRAGCPKAAELLEQGSAPPRVGDRAREHRGVPRHPEEQPGFVPLLQLQWPWVVALQVAPARLMLWDEELGLWGLDGAVLLSATLAQPC